MFESLSYFCAPPKIGNSLALRQHCVYLADHGEVNHIYKNCCVAIKHAAMMAANGIGVVNCMSTSKSSEDGEGCVDGLLQMAETFDGGDEIVGAGEGLGVAGEGVALAVDEAGHAVEHFG